MQIWGNETKCIRCGADITEEATPENDFHYKLMSVREQGTDDYQAVEETSAYLCRKCSYECLAWLNKGVER